MAYDNLEPDFDLDGDEGTVMDIGPVEVDPDLGVNDWLIGKVLSPHKVEAGIFRSVMLRLWESRNCIEIRNVGFNLFSFRFAAEKDKELVLRSGPWLFNRHLIALNNFDLTVNPTSIPLTRVPIWVQAHGLPYTMRTEKMARSLGAKFGGFMEWDKYEARRYGVSLRIRVWLNIASPLRRGQMVAGHGGAPLRVSFKYEKIVNFCFRCGMIDHVTADCALPDDGTPNRFGMWLRGEVERRRGNRRDYRQDDGDLPEDNEDFDEEGQHDGLGSEPNTKGLVTGAEDEGNTGKNPSDNMHVIEEQRNTKRTSDDEGEKNQRPGKEKAGNEYIFGSQRVHGNNSPWKRQPRNNARGIHIREGGGAQYENEHRKRTTMSSSLFGPQNTGFSPPLKKQTTDSGLGMAEAVDQPGPPQ